MLLSSESRGSKGNARKEVTIVKQLKKHIKDVWNLSDWVSGKGGFPQNPKTNTKCSMQIHRQLRIPTTYFRTATLETSWSKARVKHISLSNVHLGCVKNAQRCPEVCAPHPHRCMINSQLKVRAESFPTTCPRHGWLKEAEELFCCTAVKLKGISQFPARNFHCFPVIEISLINCIFPGAHPQNSNTSCFSNEAAKGASPAQVPEPITSSHKKCDRFRAYLTFILSHDWVACRRV